MRIAVQAFQFVGHSGTLLFRVGGAEAVDKYLECGSAGAQFQVTWDGTNYIVTDEGGTLNVEV